MGASLHIQREILKSWQRLSTSSLALSRSFELLQGGSHPPQVNALLRSLQKSAGNGRSLAEERTSLATLFGPSVASLIVAGEEAGCLEKTLSAAITFVETHQLLRRKLLLAVAYPALITLAAALLLPIPTLFSHGLWTAFIRYYLPIVLVAAGVYYGVAYLLGQWRGGGEARLRLESRILSLPVAGGLLRSTGQALFFVTLGTLLEAGLALPRACREACCASGVSILAGAAKRLAAAAEGGQPLSTNLQGETFFGADVVRQLRVGEETGDLPEACRLQAEKCSEDISRAGTLLAVVAGCCLTGLVVLLLAIYIISFWTSYFRQGMDAGLY